MARIPSPSMVKGGDCSPQVGLENELRTDLTDTARCSRGGLTELAAVGIADHAAGQEVGVVEDIEHLEAEIKSHVLRDFRVFFHTQIRAYPSRSREQELLGAAGHAAGFVNFNIRVGGDVAIAIWKVRGEG